MSIASKTPKASMSATLLFNAAGQHELRMHDNPHDVNSTNGVLVGRQVGKPKDRCINNGMYNDFPFLNKEVVKRSSTSKRAHQNVCSILNGTNWIYEPDSMTPASEVKVREVKEKYNAIGLFGSKFISRTHSSNYLHGGSVPTLAFGTDGRQFVLSKLQQRPYTTFRLSELDFDEMRGIERSMHHLYHRDWGYMYNSYHRNFIHRKIVDWPEWNRNYKKHKNNICRIPALDSNLDLSVLENRMQSYLIKIENGIDDHYPEPSWYTGEAYNYARAEFERSCYWIDDILNGMHAAGIMKVFHSDYDNPDSDEARETFARQSQEVFTSLKGSHRSGTVHVAAYTTNAEGEEEPVNGTMRFEPFNNVPGADRHEALDKIITRTLRVSHCIIVPELMGITPETSSLLEGGDKLMNAIRIYNLFVIRPHLEMLNSFVNDIINPLLGIEERFEAKPNLAAFASISTEIMKHFLHPEQVYEIYSDFGINAPTADQIKSGLIPAYRGGGETLNGF